MTTRENNLRYVIRNQDVIRDAYGNNRYFAVVGGVIVDSDRFKALLSQRITKKFPSRDDILITTVNEAVNPRIVDMDSPEVQRA